MSDSKPVLQQLAELRQALSDGILTPQQIVQKLAPLINYAMDHRDANVAKEAISIGGVLLSAAQMESPYKALLYYFMANAWSAVGLAAHSADEDAKWQWQRAELEQELFFLRSARQEPGFAKLHSDQRARILTNSANLLSSVGRFVEACELYQESLKIVPDFGMAVGNMGRAFDSYARAHYDRGQQHALLSKGLILMKRALEMPLEGNAKEGFERVVAAIEKIIMHPEKHTERLHEAHSLGTSKSERTYRKWCLVNTLFLNPLNDIGPLEIAAYDSLLLPDITTGIDEGPWFLGYFNQLKQEFVSARLIFYEGISARRAHWSDLNNPLFDTFDSSVYGLAQEKIKLTYRMAYSLLDKIAFFMNEYFELGIAERDVSFGGVWHIAGKFKNGINPALSSKKNWPLRGLYWLSRDLFEDGTSFTEVLEPDAKDLRSLRNSLEHKYVKVCDDLRVTHAASDPLHDTLARKFGRKEFNEKALRLLKLSRSALIYLSFAIHREEGSRLKSMGTKKSKGIAAPMNLPLIKDKNKI